MAGSDASRSSMIVGTDTASIVLSRSTGVMQRIASARAHHRRGSGSPPSLTRPSVRRREGLGLGHGHRVAVAHELGVAALGDQDLGVARGARVALAEQHRATRAERHVPLAGRPDHDRGGAGGVLELLPWLHVSPLLRRRPTSRTRPKTAATRTPRRLTTGEPAASRRSTGSAGALSIRRTVAACSAAGAAGAGGGGAASLVSTVDSSAATNWSSSLALTSAITPRPNCATLPVTVRTVTTETWVPPTLGVGV